MVVTPHPGPACQANRATWAAPARVALGLAAIAAPLLVHAALAGGVVPRWPAWLVGAAEFGAVGALAAGLAGSVGRRLAPLAFVAAAGLFLLGVRRVGDDALVAAGFAAHTVLWGGIALLFGRSLRPPSEPLIRRLARVVEPAPTPRLLRYADRVTALWFGFGVAQLAGSALLLGFAGRTAWSWFVNVLDAPLAALVFAAEYGWRRWRFRGAPLAGLLETARAFECRRGDRDEGDRRDGTAA